MKVPKERATYAELLEHEWMKKNQETYVDMERWVKCAVEARNERSRREKEAAVRSQNHQLQQAHSGGLVRR